MPTTGTLSHGYLGLHSVRGLVDTASPLGARWLTDEACDDQFSALVVAAQRVQLQELVVDWPDGEKTDCALVGRGGSPSLVWHAQAVGMLLELGFLPSASCVREHLRILERRLAPTNAVNPLGQEQRHPWLLRTRHVAWVVACLAELPSFAVSEETLTGQRVAAALDEHSAVLGVAANYLLGKGGGPAEWIGRNDGDDRWTEVWGEERQPNAINTVYSTLAICRAERHGFLTSPDETAVRRLAETTKMFDRLLVENLVVEPHPTGPEVKWNLPWREGWIAGDRIRGRHDLPDGIVGLLTLALVEYSSLLQELSEPESEEEHRATAARMLARRLSHVLIYRATDQRRRSPHTPHWTTAADAFFNQEAEGEWYVPSYSVCVRAILETGVVPPNHPVVRHAFLTIDRLAAQRGDGKQTWIDPTRYPDVAAQAAPGDFQHGKVDVSLATPTYDTEGALIGENASGLHAAVMAYAGLRRALAREDPRDLLDPPPLDHGNRPRSPFGRIEAVREEGTKYAVRVTAEGSEVHRYEETTELRLEAIFLLQTLAEAEEPMPRVELARAIHRRAGRSRHSRRPRSVSGLVGDINRQFGVRLIESVHSENGVSYTLRGRLVVHQ